MSDQATTIDGVSRTVVSAAEWQRAREAMTEKEKAHMRAGDKLAAERRQMPWLKMGGEYTFEGPAGRTDLAGLFRGRKQLIVYHFMFGPDVEGWPEAGCVGCSFLADQVGHLDHLHARGVEFVFVSAAPLENLQRYRTRMGWKIPWFSCSPEFNRACDVAKDLGNDFGLNVFYCDSKDIYRTHFVTHRGGEVFGNTWSLLDVTPLGRRENWEESPAGTPQGEPYSWWRRHGEYSESHHSPCCAGKC